MTDRYPGNNEARRPFVLIAAVFWTLTIVMLVFTLGWVRWCFYHWASAWFGQTSFTEERPPNASSAGSIFFADGYDKDEAAKPRLAFERQTFRAQLPNIISPMYTPEEAERS